MQTYLGPLGMTGQTAYIGLFNHGNIQKGQSILVSSAGGSVGSTVCQIAKNLYLQQVEVLDQQFVKLQKI